MTRFWIILFSAVGFAGSIQAQSKKKHPQTRVAATVKAPADSAFRYIVPIELAHIFKRYKRFPAILKTDEQEKWIKPGLVRNVYFEDGSRAKESLLTVVPNTSFSYKIEDFSSELRYLAKRIEGNWLFTDLGNGYTGIEWTYQVVPKNFVARFIINTILIKDLEGLLGNALTIIKTDLENGK